MPPVLIAKLVVEKIKRIHYNLALTSLNFFEIFQSYYFFFRFMTILCVFIRYQEDLSITTDFWSKGGRRNRLKTKASPETRYTIIKMILILAYFLYPLTCCGITLAVHISLDPHCSNHAKGDL